MVAVPACWPIAGTSVRTRSAAFEGGRDDKHKTNENVLPSEVSGGTATHSPRTTAASQPRLDRTDLG
ncbi:hypothetical protein CKAH01_02818 [Colletotrichum kahawae]|uniref:Uncharacterized protein n=1 Tax=Colletotrichum kahawae TaxID=34407 RepID=A0AAD9XWN0_COLKA|nr:hypothetical protein CKAH01_02818 [Colletotrichum kahawae]